MELAIYEGAAEFSSAAEIVKYAIERLKGFRVTVSFITPEVVLSVLHNMKLDREENIQLFKRVLSKTLTKEDTRNNQEIIIDWLSKLYAWRLMQNGVVIDSQITEQVYNNIKKAYSFLKLDSNRVNKYLTSLGIGLSKNIELFVRFMKSKEERCRSLIEMPEDNNALRQKAMEEKEKQATDIENLSDTIIGILECIKEEGRSGSS